MHADGVNKHDQNNNFIQRRRLRWVFRVVECYLFWKFDGLRKNVNENDPMIVILVEYTDPWTYSHESIPFFRENKEFYYKEFQIVDNLIKTPV